MITYFLGGCILTKCFPALEILQLFLKIDWVHVKLHLPLQPYLIVSTNQWGNHLLEKWPTIQRGPEHEILLTTMLKEGSSNEWIAACCSFQECVSQHKLNLNQSKGPPDVWTWYKYNGTLPPSPIYDKGQVNIKIKINVLSKRMLFLWSKCSNPQTMPHTGPLYNSAALICAHGPRQLWHCYPNSCCFM